MSESSTLVDFYNGFASTRVSSTKAPSSGEKVASPSSDKTHQSNGHFNDVTEFHETYGMSDVHVTGSSAARDRINRKKFGNYSLLLRRIEYQDPTMKSKAQLEIQSDILCEAFREIASRFSYLPLHKHPIIIEDPYWELYHCHKDIKSARDDTTSQTLANELGLLLGFHERFLSRTEVEVTSMVKMGKITFQHLWTLFPPGELVVLQNELGGAEPVLSCAIVQRYELQETQTGVSWKLSVTQGSIDYSGKKKVIETHLFKAFSGALDITDLPAFPIKCHPDEAALRDSMAERAQRYITLHHAFTSRKSKGVGAHFEHRGSFWTPMEPSKSRKGCTYFEAPSKHISGRFIVDPDGMVGEMPIFRDSHLSEKKTSGPSRFSGFSSMNHRLPRELQAVEIRSRAASAVSHGPDPSCEELIIFPARVQGYSLSQKAWGYVLIEDLEEIAWEENCFDKLQINPEHKDIVRTLVDSHRASADGFDDIIRGKGLGLVFLLWGPPGSGKTMTAEVVAECLHSPLYTITSGKLGSETSNVEASLKNVFKLSTRWNAVLLLDEADVFMAERTKQNSTGNELVSVFLRLVEYQSGVLFLTSNRTNNLDPAFSSRIHVSIPYSSAGPKERKLIWRQLADKIDHVLTDDDFEQVAKVELSGREIKNVLRVASLHARHPDSAGSLARRDIDLALEYVFRTPTSGHIAL